jgi:hypothetical protein
MPIGHEKRCGGLGFCTRAQRAITPSHHAGNTTSDFKDTEMYYEVDSTSIVVDQTKAQITATLNLQNGINQGAAFATTLDLDMKFYQNGIMRV